MDSTPRPFDHCAFVAVTTTDLARARAFWVETMGCPVEQEEAGLFVMVDVGGLRLCLDVPDGDTHLAGGADPVIGLTVRSLADALSTLERRGVRPVEPPVRGTRGAYARVRDPDGRVVVLTEGD